MLGRGPESILSHPNRFLPVVQFGGGFLLSWGAVASRGGTGYEKFCKPFFCHFVCLGSIQITQLTTLPMQHTVRNVQLQVGTRLIQVPSEDVFYKEN